MSVILWASGLAKNWATSKVGNYIADAYNDKSLDGQLSKTVEAWLAQNSFYDTPVEAIFNWYHKEAIPEQPCRKELSDVIMKQNRIPSKAQWNGALIERYNEVRSIRLENQHLQSLFELQLEEVGILFNNLASNLHDICTQNLNLYTVTTHNVLQEIKEDIERLINQKPSKETELLLHNFSDFLDNKRVLYLGFNLEENYPLIAMTKSIEEIRQKLINEVVVELPVNSEERNLAKNMIEACHLFNNKIMSLRHQVLEDTVTPLYKHDKSVLKKIEESLEKFRLNFIQPMFWLLTQFKVNIPHGILRNQLLIPGLNIPSIVYAQGIPVRTDKLFYYAGYEEIGYFLRIFTIAQDYAFQNISFPMNTEVILYDPKEVKSKNRIWQVTLGNDLKINDKEWKKDDKFYFDKAGQLQLKDPEEKKDI